MSASTHIHLNDTEDVVAWIAANVSKTIAKASHEGHDLNTVMTRMTSDRVLNLIRTAYLHCARQGQDRPDAIRRIGVRLIAEYCRQYDL